MPRRSRAPAFALLAGCVVLGSGCRTTAEALPKWDEQTPGDGDEAGVMAANDPGGAPEETADGENEAGESTASQEVSAAFPAGAGQLPAPIHRKVDRSCGRDPGIGQRLKGFELQTPDGKPISPGKFRGRVLLVNFWGTWCKPCLKELPEFDQLYRRYRKHGLTLVAIATDEDPEPVREYVKRRKLTAKIAIGGESYANGYRSDKFPFSFVVDGRGVIRASYRGFKPECLGKLEADVRAELEKRGR